MKAHKGPRKGSVVRLAIVGVGDISPRYFKQAAASKRALFVATCAHHLDSAKKRAEEYGVSAWYDDYNVMFDKERPDGVVIVTPNNLHAAPAIAALDRGIHVLVEKPMATSWADCKAMVAAARRSDAVLLALPYDAHPPFLAALQHLNQETLGVFTGADAQLLIPGPGRDNWYYDKKTAGGAMLDSMVYPVSILIGLLGPAKQVTGSVNTLIPHRIVGGQTVDLTPPQLDKDSKVIESNVDDNISLVVDWPSGQQALLRTLWGTSFFRADTVVYGRQGTLWLTGFGSEVIIHSPLRPIPDAAELTWNGIEHCYRLPAKNVSDIKDEGLIEHFVDCIDGKAKPTCGGEQQLHVHEILFKGYDAAQTGQAQTLETTFTPWHSIDPAFYNTRSRPV
jgi:predicted dehydrogenase